MARRRDLTGGKCLPSGWGFGRVSGEGAVRSWPQDRSSSTEDHGRLGGPRSGAPPRWDGRELARNGRQAPVALFAGRLLVASSRMTLMSPTAISAIETMPSPFCVLGLSCFGGG
jgi:hypothetical protein